MIKKICEHCKKPFYIYPYRAATAKYCSRSCASASKVGNRQNAWKTGRNIMVNGYTRIRINKKYVYEHRYVMEQFLKRPLKRNEVVHHIDGDKTNNALKNLELLTKSEHDRKETVYRWSQSPASFLGKERCGAPRLGRHGKGKFCKRFRPCYHHGTI